MAAAGPRRWRLQDRGRRRRPGSLAVEPGAGSYAHSPTWGTRQVSPGVGEGCRDGFGWALVWEG